MQETKVQYLGWEDLLEKEMATHSSILTGKILWTKELITVHGFTKSQIQLSTRMCAHVHTHTHTHTKSESSKMEFKRFLGKIPIFIFMKLRLKFSISFHCE